MARKLSIFLSSRRLTLLVDQSKLLLRATSVTWRLVIFILDNSDVCSPRTTSKAPGCELGPHRAFVDLEVKRRIHTTLENTFSFKEEYFVFISNTLAGDEW